MTLIAGVATALLVFACGLRFLSPGDASLAAGLTALSPLAFRESAVVNPDLDARFLRRARAPRRAAASGVARPRSISRRGSGGRSRRGGEVHGCSQRRSLSARRASRARAKAEGHMAPRRPCGGALRLRHHEPLHFHQPFRDSAGARATRRVLPREPLERGARGVVGARGAGSRMGGSAPRGGRCGGRASDAGPEAASGPRLPGDVSPALRVLRPGLSETCPSPSSRGRATRRLGPVAISREAPWGARARGPHSARGGQPRSLSARGKSVARRSRPRVGGLGDSRGKPSASEISGLRGSTRQSFACIG